MSDNGYRKIVIDKIIAEETRKAMERFGHLNHLDLECLERDLSPDEFIEVLEGVLRNFIKICESRLKNSFSKKERYIEMYAKKLTGFVNVYPTSATDESDPQLI